MGLAIKAQDEKIVEKKVNDAVSTVDLAVPTATEDAGFKDLSSGEKNTARARLSNKIFTDFANSTTDIPTLLAQVDAYKAAGQISEATAEGVKTALNQKVADLAKSIQSDLDAGILAPAGVEARLATITNPDLRKLVGAKFGEVVDTQRYSTDANNFLSNNTTTMTTLNTALNARTPAEAAQIRKQLDEKITKKATDYRTAVESGQMSVADVQSAISGFSPYERERIEAMLGARVRAGEFQSLVDTIPHINTVQGVRDAMTAIASSPFVAGLPANQAEVIKQAIQLQTERYAGTDLVYKRRLDKLDAEQQMRTLEINKKNWDITIRRLKGLAVPAAIITALSVLTGVGVGVLVGGPGGVAAGIAGGIISSGVYSGFGVGANNLLEHRFGYVSQSRLDMQKLEIERRDLLEKDADISREMDTIRAERASMPLQALDEATDLMAEVAWLRFGKGSGIPKDQFMKEFVDSTRFPALSELRKSISQMTNTPSSVPLT